MSRDNKSQAAVFEPLTGELSFRRIQGPPLAALEFLTELGPGLRAVYEAGPTGFGLARAARDQGIDLRVVSPGQIPKRPSDRVKTDRKDAERLVRLLAAGELCFAYVPTLEQEHFRDLVRAIEDARKDQMRARHRLSKFLLRRDLRFPGKGANWTQAHLRWLEQLSFEDAASRATFADYLAAVHAIAQRRQTLVQTLEQLVPLCPHAEAIARLRCFRGVDTLTAAGLCAEVSDFARFPRPKQLWGFLGIVPSEHSSGDQRVQGSITKAGSAHARRLLVEAVPKYRDRPRIGADLERRQRGQGSARRRGRLARPAACPPPLGPARHRARQAEGRRDRRLRARAGVVPLGGSDPRLRPQRHSPGAAGAHGQAEGPGCRIQGSAQALWAAGPPVVPAARPRPATNKGHEVTSPRISA
jgi:transposase